MNSQRVLHSAVFVIVFVVCLCIFAPAALVGGYLQALSGGRLILAQTQGTVWSGTGILLLCHENEFLPLGRYAWHIHPAATLSQVNVNLETGNDGSEIQLSPWRGEVVVQKAHTHLPAQLLAVFAPQLSPYRLSGELELTTANFTLAAQRIDGLVTLDWKQVASGLTDIAPLGDYRIALQGAGNALNVTLTTQSGKLRLSGSGKIQPGQALSFSGTAQAAPGQQEILSELLHHIGPEMSSGIFGFSLLTH